MQGPPTRPVHKESRDERHCNHYGTDADGRKFRTLVC